MLRGCILSIVSTCFHSSFSYTNSNIKQITPNFATSSATSPGKDNGGTNFGNGLDNGRFFHCKEQCGDISAFGVLQSFNCATIDSSSPSSAFRYPDNFEPPAAAQKRAQTRIKCFCTSISSAEYQRPTKHRRAKATKRFRIAAAGKARLHLLFAETPSVTNKVAHNILASNASQYMHG